MNVPFKLVDITTKGFEGFANLIYTGEDCEGFCVAMLYPSMAEALRNVFEAAPDLLEALQSAEMALGGYLHQNEITKAALSKARTAIEKASSD